MAPKKPTPPDIEIMREDGCGVVGLLVVLLILLACLGCGSPKLVESRECGTLVDIEFVSGSWNSPVVSRVETTKGVFIIPGMYVSGVKDQSCTIDTYDDGMDQKLYLHIGNGRGYLFEVR